MSDKLIEVNNVRKVFKSDAEQELEVLSDVNFAMEEGEVVALLGRSGSGKSTLLRIIAGLIEATSGEVSYRGKPVSGSMHGIAMVFQSFALMPWLTVLQNVELGLEALGVSRERRRQRALKAIDIVGLDGFESAFPKELSGGMCQRVGFARALVVDPCLLLMDEPFSALDVLTSDNLRDDLMELWDEGQTALKGILLVTHDIQEALIMADRILIFDSNPGRVRHDLKVDLPRPRDDEDVEFKQLQDQIYTLMTAPSAEFKSESGLGLGYRVPDARVTELIGLLEAIGNEESDVPLDFAYLAEQVHLDVDELIALTEVLEILQFTQSTADGIDLTEAGACFANADILEQKQIFAKHLLQQIPLVKRICTVLRARPKRKVAKKFFLTELEDYFSEADAERVLQVVIEWGRFAELFAYDDSVGKLSLEDPG